MGCYSPSRVRPCPPVGDLFRINLTEAIADSSRPSLNKLAAGNTARIGERPAITQYTHNLQGSFSDDCCRRKGKRIPGSPAAQKACSPALLGLWRRLLGTLVQAPTLRLLYTTSWRRWDAPVYSVSTLVRSDIHLADSLCVQLQEDELVLSLSLTQQRTHCQHRLSEVLAANERLREHLSRVGHDEYRPAPLATLRPTEVHHQQLEALSTHPQQTFPAAGH